MSENKRYSFKYYNDVYMIRIIDNYKEEPNGWGVCNVKETVQRLNELHEENKLHKERISLLSSLLDLADAIIDTSDNEKAKQVWNNKNEQTKKEWEKILND